MTNKKETPIIPDDHPRAQSLHYRHILVEGMEKKIVTPSGLCAHGRGEAFDYMLGEEIIPPALEAIKAALAAILLADHPVISVNGNVAALIPKEIVKLSNILDIPLEVNIFYKAPGRIEAITSLLRDEGAKMLYGTGDIEPKQLLSFSSNRRIVDPRGIYKADLVLIPLEDGDRAENLVAAGKKTIAIDLNPLSRTAQKSNITIVDNIIRTVPKMIELASSFKSKTEKELEKILQSFDQKDNLNRTIKYIINYLQTQLKKTI